MPDLSHIRRVLIIRMSAIGDVVHALHFASALKIAHPHLEISWVAEEIPAPLVQANPYLHHVYVIPRSKWNRGRLNSPEVWKEYLAFIRELRRQNFDLTIDLQGYAKSALIVAGVGARYRIGWHRLKDGANLASRAVARRAESLHRIDWFLDVARGLGIAEPVAKCPILIPNRTHEELVALLEEGGIARNQPFVVINQAAGNRPRQWGEANYEEVAIWLAEKHRLPVVLVGTLAERETCERIRLNVCKTLEAKALQERFTPLNLAGKTDLIGLACLLEMCVLHLCGDTGSTHIAAALGTPVVAFYGASDPLHAGPWNQLENVLSKRELCHQKCSVRTCHYSTEDAGNEFPKPDTARCMDAISPAEAETKIDSALISQRERLAALR